MNFRFWLSGVFAFFLEALLVFAIFFALLPKLQKQYTFENKTVLEFIQIDVVVEKKQEEKKPQTQKQEIKKTPPTPKTPPKQKASAKPSPKVGADVRQLFAKIDSFNPPVRNEEIQDDRPTFSANAIKKQEYSFSQDRLKIQEESFKIQNALDMLWEKELEISPPQNVDMSEGEYDAWFAQIKSILYAKWVNTFYESVAISVSITIEPNGRFNYRIIRYSKNQSYNVYMEEMLNELKNEEFPPYPKGRITLEVIFKTKEQSNE